MVGFKGHAITVLKEMVLILLGFCYLVFVYGAEGGGIRGEEVLKKDMQLLPPHKNTVKTLQNIVGDIFDCVGIYNQPAFDHPLLKNHTIQMMPTSSPKGTSNEEASGLASSNIGFMNESCPKGTIPIMRIMKEGHEGAISMPKFKDINVTEIYPHYDTKDGSYIAAIIKMDPDTYYGTRADLNVWRPLVSAKQASYSLVIVTNEGTRKMQQETNSVIAGWTVNPKLFGDDFTRLFVYYTVSGYSTGCCNLLCPGFVQVSTEIPLGAVLSPTSIYDGEQYILRVLIYKDPLTKNWWMLCGPQNKPVGYWPESLFNSLQATASNVAWGGVVFTPPDERLPPMGSGHLPFEGDNRACFTKRIKLVNEKNELLNPKRFHSDFILDKGDSYTVGKYIYSKEGFHFMFGGPWKE